MVEGPTLVDHAARAGWEVEAVFVGAGHWSYRPPAELADTAVFELAPNVLERVASTDTPQPVLAVVRRRTSPLELLATATFVVVGDRIADPGNAGTMLRSAEAAGADAVVFTQGSVDVFNPKVVRSSAGALFEMPVVVDIALDELLSSPATAAPHLVRNDVARRGAAEGHEVTDHTEVDLASPVLLVLGNEAAGVSAGAAVAALDHRPSCRPRREPERGDGGHGAGIRGGPSTP